MKNLWNKELKLAVPPMVWVFSLFGLMIFIPGYPNSIFLIYVFISFIYLFQGGKENNDLYYSIFLPIRKRDIIKARFLSVLAFEMLSILASAVVGIITYKMGYGPIGKQISNNGEVSIGIPPCPFFFGSVFLSFAVFNSLFFFLHYRKNFPMIVPMLTGSLVGILPSVAAEILASLFATPLESISHQIAVIAPDTMLTQLLMLFLSMGVYAGSLVLSFKSAAKRFEAMDL